MRVQVDKSGEFGLVTDPSSQEIPPNAWNVVRNIRFDLQAARNCTGYEEIVDVSDDGTYLLGLDFDGAWYMVYPTTDAIYSWDGTSETEITRTAGYNGTGRWNGCVLGGVIVLNNYGDCPQYWGGSGDASDLMFDDTNTWDSFDGGTGLYRAKVIRSFKNFLFALGISEDNVEYPYMVHWSHPADPGALPSSWDYADATKLSGRVDLSDSPGYVVDAVALRDIMVVYKEDSVWLASYVGGQYQFRFDKLAQAEGMGIFSQDCAIDIGGKHIVVGDGVVYMHDGETVEHILKGKAAEALFSAIDADNYQKTFLMHCACSTEVLVCYPPTGASYCTRAYVYNYLENTWSWRELPDVNFMTGQVVASAGPRSWPSSGDPDNWDGTIDSWDDRSYSPISDTIVGIGTKLWKFTDSLTTFDGTNPVCMLERTGMRLGEGGQVSLIREVYPRVIGGPVQIQVGSQMKLQDQVRWGPAITFDPTTDSKINTTQAGVFHAIRFKTSGGERWRLNGYELDIEPTGVY